MPPIRYVGRTTSHVGKKLWDIVFRLKDFGAGRFVYRHTLYNKDPEPSFFKITGVEPTFLPKTPDDRPKNPAGHIKGTITGIEIRNGKLCGEVSIPKCPQADWRLVPKNEEAEFLRILETAPPKPESIIIEEQVKYPPLLEILTKAEQKRTGKSVSDDPLMLTIERTVEKTT